MWADLVVVWIFDLGLIHTQNLTWDGYFMIEVVIWGNKKETKVAATSFLSRRTI